MGLFGSSKKTFVGTSVSRVIEDDALPHAVLEGMARDIKEETGQMVEQVMESLSNSIGIRAQRMYAFGRDQYLYGLPSGEVYSSHAGKEAAEAVLEAQTGGPVSMVYYHYGPLNNLHVAWKKLTEQHGYDAVTNQIMSLSTVQKPVFLKDMRVVVAEATLEELSNGSLEQWGTPPTAGPTPEKKHQTTAAGSLVKNEPYAVDLASSVDYILVDTCWSEKTPITPGNPLMKEEIKFGTFRMELTDFDFEGDYHQAKYVDQAGQTHYWMYQVDGTYPELDTTFEKAYAGEGHFFPWMYFRFNKTSQAADVNSRAYKDSKRLARILNMDYDQLVEGIHENPDIGDVEQAMMIMAVPADTDEEIERRYLFDFFTGLYEQQKLQGQKNVATNPAYNGIFRSLAEQLNRTSMVIQDSRFKMALNWKHIVRRKVGGKVGPKGAYFSGTGRIPKWIEVPSLSGDPLPKDMGSQAHWYQHQLSENVYEEVIVYDLELVYHVFEGYTTTGDETDKILLIPMDISIASAYSIPDRELLYSRALHYVFNSRVVVKLKWYQTGIFRAVLIIVMIIITILTYGATIKGLYLAIIAGTITWGALLIVALQFLIRQLIISVLLRMFVKAVGAKVAFVAAVVAAIAGSSYAFEAGIQGSPIATQLVGIASGLSQQVAREIAADMEDLVGQQSDFQKFVEQQTKVLETTQDLLSNSARLAPLIIFGEKPTDFYQRTVHSGNIGTIGMDAISSFVDVALTLPKLSDTLT